MNDQRKSSEIWDAYGQYVLLATDYRDQVLSEANGAVIRDADGNEFMDLESGQICAILGHNHPELTRRLVEQLSKLSHVGTAFLSLPVFEAAEKIASVAPGNLKKSILLSTGAEANECAFRIAKACTGKRGLIGFHRGYAGLTLATSSVGGNSQDTAFAMPGGFKMVTPDCRHCSVHASYPQCDFLCLKVSEELLLGHCDNNIAAFVVEPILSAGGMIFPPDGYFRRLKSLAEKMDALLIADEAQTGMARTGRWFGMQHDEVVPDILVMSKGVGGGFPASAVVVSDAVAAGALGRFSNFSSHQSDPLPAVAISTVIDIINEENLVAAAKDNGDYFRKNLTQLAEQYPLIGGVRGKGLMIGIDAVKSTEKKLSASEVGQFFEYFCRRRGVHLKSIHGGKIFRLLPPLTITRDEIDRVISIFEDVLKAMQTEKLDIKDTYPQNAFALQRKQASEQKLTWKGLLKKGWQTSPDQMVVKLKRKIKSNLRQSD